MIDHHCELLSTYQTSNLYPMWYMYMLLCDRVWLYVYLFIYCSISIHTVLYCISLAIVYYFVFYYTPPHIFYTIYIIHLSWCWIFLYSFHVCYNSTTNYIPLLAMDILVLVPMKNAANCEMWCELQMSVNHPIFERNWRFLACPESTCPSVSVHIN